MSTSMLKTLAGKHRSTVSKMADIYEATIDTPAGPRVCFQATVERAGRNHWRPPLGGIPLKRRRKAVLDDRQPGPRTGRRHGSELLNRLRRGRCEWCEQRSQVQVHQVSKLADLATGGRPQPAWAQLMARMRRETLIVCPPCHDRLHNRQPAHTLTCSHWRARCSETGTAGSDRGSLEKGLTTGTSPAAYRCCTTDEIAAAVQSD
jgi:predicted metal-binding protein